MSIYSEMLRMVLAEQAEGDDVPVGSLVREALSRRAVLLEPVAPPQSRRGVADRIGDALAYDAALVRLCERLGIGHELTAESAGPAARRQAEERLAEHLPSIAAALEGTRPGFTVSEV